MSETKNTDAEIDEAVNDVLAESDDWVEDPTPSDTKPAARLDTTIAVRLDADTAERLLARSEARGIGYSALVRELIDNYLAVDGLPVSEAADELLRLVDEVRRKSGQFTAAAVNRAAEPGIRGSSKDVGGLRRGKKKV